jgi:AcrR family transcriptional regulator
MRTKNPALREDMRDQIIDAANRLIERYGYRKTTIEDIAREAGIGKGTVYLYFPSKEEVALSCCGRLALRTSERLRSLSRAAGTPAERLKKMIVERVMMKFDAVSGFGESLDEILADLRQTIFERREKWMAVEAEILAEVLIEGRLLGAFSCDDAVSTAYTILTATSGLMPASLSPKEMADREGVRAKATQIAELMISGLQRR